MNSHLELYQSLVEYSYMEAIDSIDNVISDIDMNWFMEAGTSNKAYSRD